MRRLVLILLAFAGLVSAQEAPRSLRLSELVPPDTLLLLEMDDLGGYEKWSKETALGRIWSEPEMQKFVGGMKKAAADAVNNARRQGFDPFAMAGLEPADFTGIVFEQGGVALIDVDLDNFGYPDAVLMLQCRKGMESVRKILRAAKMAAGTFAGVGFTPAKEGDIEIFSAEIPGGGAVAYAIAGDRLVMTSSVKRLKDVLGRLKGTRAANLRGSPALGGALKRLGAKRNGTVFYLDAKRAGKIGMALMRTFADEADVREAEMIASAIGLDAVEHVVVTDIPQGPNFRTEFLIKMSERKGLFGFMQDAPTAHRFASFVPREPLLYASEKSDVARYFDDGVKWAETFEPGATKEVQQILQRYNRVLGIDLRKDLIGSLGDEWGFYVDAPPGGGLIPDMVMFASLRDREKLHKSLRALVERYPDVLAMYGEGTVERSPKIRHRKTTFGDHEIHCIEIVDRRGEPIPVVPCWTMGKDYVAMALWPATLKHALTRKSSLADNPRFQELRAAIPQGAISCGYWDMPKFVGWGYNTVVPALQGVQGAINHKLKPYGASVNMHDLPPASVILKHLTPVMSYTKIEKDAVRFGYVSPCGLSLATIVPAAAVAAAISVDTMERGRHMEMMRARERAERARLEAEARRRKAAAEAAARGKKEAAEVAALRKQLAAQRARYERRIRQIERQIEELKKLLQETK
ncbi:MAG: DUF3352 domain-containing protein [Planctomycetota bacterium]|jgi:hypothetical protein